MKNQYTVNKELFKSWAKEYHISGVPGIILFALYIFVGILGAIVLVISIMNKDYLRCVLGVLFIALAIYKLFLYRFHLWSYRYKVLSKTYGVSEWNRTIEFLESEIVITDHNSISKFKYDNIKKIKEKDDKIDIILNNNLSIRIYKSAFCEGNWEECKNFILSKVQL